MPVNHLTDLVVLMENDQFAQNLAALSIEKQTKRTFGKELQNQHSQLIVTPKHKRQKIKETTSSSKKERVPFSFSVLLTPPHELSEDNKKKILKHLQSQESKYLVNKDFLKHQRDLNAQMRAILIDWLVDVCLKFEVAAHVLSSTVVLIDRYLEKVQTSRSKLQLLGVTCLMIVCKFEEVYPPMLKDFLSVCDNAYSKPELLKMESDILLKLKFEIAQTTAFCFLTFFNSTLKMDDKSYFFAWYALENCLLDVVCLKHKHSILAAASIFFVNKLFKKEGWGVLHQEISGFQEGDLKLAARDLFVVLQRNDVGEFKAITRKFSEPNYCEVSQYTIQKKKEAPEN